jgi:hypothetical protein
MSVTPQMGTVETRPGTTPLATPADRRLRAPLEDTIMSGIDEVLERLVTDRGFQERFRRDPASALSGYVLYDEDLQVLAAALDDGPGGDHGVEQRTSKSTFVAALTGLLEGAGGVGGTASADTSPEAGRSAATDVGDIADPGADADAETKIKELMLVKRSDTPGDTSVPQLRDLPVDSDGSSPATDEVRAAPDVLETDVHEAIQPAAAAHATPDGSGVEPEVAVAASDDGDGQDATGPAGLRSDGELVQDASSSRDLADADGTADGAKEDVATALPRSGRSGADMSPGIEGSDVSTG